MTTEELTRLKFPIGKFIGPNTITTQIIQTWIKEIADFPAKLKNLTGDLNTEKLNWKYRPGGWTIKQLVHHCADSHMNSYIRFKLALTEDTPIIRPYFEDRWAELPDSQDDDISDSMTLLTGLHSKWVKVLKSLDEDQLKLSFLHPESGQETRLGHNIGLYAWHCNHHFAHIELALTSNGEYNG